MKTEEEQNSTETSKVSNTLLYNVFDDKLKQNEEELRTIESELLERSEKILNEFGPEGAYKMAEFLQTIVKTSMEIYELSKLSEPEQYMELCGEVCLKRGADLKLCSTYQKTKTHCVDVSNKREPDTNTGEAREELESSIGRIARNFLEYVNDVKIGDYEYRRMWEDFTKNNKIFEEELIEIAALMQNCENHEESHNNSQSDNRCLSKEHFIKTFVENIGGEMYVYEDSHDYSLGMKPMGEKEVIEWAEELFNLLNFQQPDK